MSILTLVVCLIFILVNGEGARILAVFPTPSISHQVVFRPLTQELAKRGHEVVVITTDPVFPKGQAPRNLTEIDVHDISYKLWRETFLATATGNKDDLILQINTILDSFIVIFEKQVQSSEVQAIINDKNNKFDLLLVEACVRPALAFSHIFKVPVIQVSSLGSVFRNYNYVGGPTHPLLYPTSTHQRVYNLTMWEKLMELYYHYQIDYLVTKHEEEENEMIKRNFPGAPSLNELNNNVDMLFLNIHPLWEGNFPVPPAVVYMGGMHQKPQKELPHGLKSYLDSSKHGVIYMSFGTNTNPSSLPAEKIRMFVKVFSELPFDILWKWDKDELPGISKNIRIGKWFPQSDLLRHPKIKLFITQGGLQSTDEAITAGVPLIGIPMLGDQWYNVEKYVHHKIGIRLDLESLTEEKLENAIKTAINDESYRRNIKKLNVLMRDQPDQPLERAVWWTEYVLRHSGARHLRSPAANISWSEYLLLDLLLVLLSIVFLVIVVVAYCVILLSKYVDVPRLKIKVQ